jgi:hypothetical protein
MHTHLWRMRPVVSLLVVLSGFLGLPRPSPAHGVEVACAAGDVACLIEAITQANATGEANTITLEAGTYTLTEVNNTTDGPNGLPSVRGVVTIQGAGADTTIIERAAGAPGFRLVHVAATGVLTVEALTLRDGFSPSSGEPGAGLLNRGTLSLSRTRVASHGADAGAGLANIRGTVTIAATAFVENIAGHPGAGLYNVEGTVTITTTTFARNRAAGGGGLNNNGGTVILTDSTVGPNSADLGGGIANSNGTVVLINSTIARNFVARFGGAGLWNDEGGTVILTNSTVAENTAIGGRGGGLSNVQGTVVLTNTILARNQILAGGAGPDCVGPVTSLGTNLVGDPTGCTITLLSTDLTGDPGLGDFSDDGTPGNGHFPLQPSSPAIDAGNDAFCPPTDQLGEPRVGRCDIGAIEFQGKHHKPH